MSFYMYDIAFLVIFCLAVFIFLYRKRDNLKREGIMYLYRTQVGIKFINYVGTKYKKTLRVFSFLSVISGYLLMAMMIYLFGQLVYIYLFVPKIVQAIKIPPIMPIFPYVDQAFKISFLPPFYFTYWIIAIAVIAIFHEFAHGIVARRYGVKIKTTGFGFLGPFLAAFVEPNEKQMQKKTKFQQIAVLSSGTFTNLILAGLFFLMLFLFFSLAYTPAGSTFNDYSYGIINISSIGMIGGINITNHSDQGIVDLINKSKIENNLIVGADNESLNFTRVIVNNSTFFVNINSLESQLSQNPDVVLLYYDLPAIRSGLKGIIIQADETKITSQIDLTEFLKNKSPGDKVQIKTKNDGNITIYNIILGESPFEKNRSVIGVVYTEAQRKGVLGQIFNFFNFYQKSATYYEPKYNMEFVIFIYNLIWWLALINLSVALMNMLPVGIFDGGAMFMLSVEWITGSKKAGEIAFKVMTYIILTLLVLIMIGWALAVF